MASLFSHTLKNFSLRSLALKKTLVMLWNVTIFSLAQIARACGRVSVSGDLDKRPVNRF
jgi:hypothetical protein